MTDSVTNRLIGDFVQILAIRGLNQQEAQLLLGDRATRKHAKDSWNGRGNDNIGW